MALVALVSILLLFSFSIKTTTLTQAHCLPDQRQALIQLKKGFKTIELHSWNTSIDCCIWDGIKCDEQTGMVTALNLADMYISGELNPALFNLSSLQYLNLAYNNFINIPLPQTGYERLANLTHLDLSYSGFAGQIPKGISALTNLISLNLSTDITLTNFLYLHDTGLKTLLSNLTKLQVLRLDGVDISLNGPEWGKAILQVGPTLQELSMTNCGLRGNFPDEIFHLTNLTELDLSFNSLLSGQLVEFTKQSFLQFLSLEDTNLTGPLPDSIENLQYLSLLNLYNCSFYGEIPSSITNLKLKSTFHWSTTWRIGDGRRISFWFHAWQGMPLCTDRGTRPQRPYISLREAIPQVHILAPGLTNLVQHIRLTRQTDQVIWRWDTQGRYTAKSVYEIMMGGGKIKSMHAGLWKYKVPSTVRIFAFLMLKEKILTHDVMVRRKMTCNMECVMCRECPLESAFHLLFRCTYAMQVWGALSNMVGFQIIEDDNTLHETWKKAIAVTRLKPTDWRRKGPVTVLCACWFIWKQRNEVIFRNRVMQPERLATVIYMEVKMWCKYC